MLSFLTLPVTVSGATSGCFPRLDVTVHASAVTGRDTAVERDDVIIDPSGDQHVAVYDEDAAGHMAPNGDAPVTDEHTAVDGAVDRHRAVDRQDRAVHDLVLGDHDATRHADAPVGTERPALLCTRWCDERNAHDNREREYAKQPAVHTRPSRSRRSASHGPRLGATTPGERGRYGRHYERAATSLGRFAGFGESGCDFMQSKVQALRGAAQDVEGFAGRNLLAFHENAFGLSDDIAAAQRSVQRGFTPAEVGTVTVEPGGDGKVRGEDGAEVEDVRDRVRARNRRRR